LNLFFKKGSRRNRKPTQTNSASAIGGSRTAAERETRQSVRTNETDIESQVIGARKKRGGLLNKTSSSRALAKSKRKIRSGESAGGGSCDENWVSKESRNLVRVGKGRHCPYKAVWRLTGGRRGSKLWRGGVALEEIKERKIQHNKGRIEGLKNTNQKKKG